MLTEPKQQGEYSIVTVNCRRLDYTNTHGFKNELLDLISQGHNKIILDMAKVEFMDSKGLSAFLFAFRAVHPEGIIILVELQEHVRKIFTLTKVDQVVPIYNKPQDALTASRS